MESEKFLKLQTLITNDTKRADEIGKQLTDDLDYHYEYEYTIDKIEIIENYAYTVSMRIERICDAAEKEGIYGFYIKLSFHEDPVVRWDQNRSENIDISDTFLFPFFEVFLYLKTETLVEEYKYDVGFILFENFNNFLSETFGDSCRIRKFHFDEKLYNKDYNVDKNLLFAVIESILNNENPPPAPADHIFHRPEEEYGGGGRKFIRRKSKRRKYVCKGNVFNKGDKNKKSKRQRRKYK